MENKMKRRLLLFLLSSIIIGILPSGCSISSSSILPILKSPNCDPPCWQGITPNKSTDTDVRNQLKNIPYIDPNHLAWRGNWNKYSNYLMLGFLGGKQSCEISFINNTVHYIFLYGNLGVHIDELIKVYGEPDDILISNLYSGDLILNEINLLYLKKGIVLSFGINRNKTSVRIDKNTKIENIVFIKNPITDLDLLSLGLFDINQSDINNRKNPWKGYDNYSISP